MKHILATGLFSTMTALALAQGGTQARDIWNAHLHIKDQNVVLVPWGSGGISETSETAFDGVFSLRISTHNYFQGGFVKFNTPIDLASSSSDPNNLLTLS